MTALHMHAADDYSLFQCKANKLLFLALQEDEDVRLISPSALAFLLCWALVALESFTGSKCIKFLPYSARWEMTGSNAFLAQL